MNNLFPNIFQVFEQWRLSLTYFGTRKKCVKKQLPTPGVFTLCSTLFPSSSALGISWHILQSCRKSITVLFLLHNKPYLWLSYIRENNLLFTNGSLTAPMFLLHLIDHVKKVENCGKKNWNAVSSCETMMSISSQWVVVYLDNCYPLHYRKFNWIAMVKLGTEPGCEPREELIKFSELYWICLSLNNNVTQEFMNRALPTYSRLSEWPMSKH